MTKRRRIVIIEDNPDIAYMAQILLARRHSVLLLVSQEERENFQEAVAWDFTRCVVVDLMMSGIRGEDILRWLKEHHPGIRRVVCTAVPAEQIPDAVFELAEAIVYKPFHIDELERAINNG